MVNKDFEKKETSSYVGCVTASSGERNGDHVRLVAEGKDFLEWLEQTDCVACRQIGHGIIHLRGF